eukprot:88969-Rhodomonas_salina.1
MALHGAWPIVKYQVTIARPAGAYASDARPSQGAAPHDTYLKHIHDFKPYLKNTHDLVHGTPFERCRSQQQHAAGRWSLMHANGHLSTVFVSKNQHPTRPQAYRNPSVIHGSGPFSVLAPYRELCLRLTKRALSSARDQLRTRYVANHWLSRADRTALAPDPGLLSRRLAHRLVGQSEVV